MRNVKTIVRVALIVMVFSVTKAFGCSCGGGGAPCDDYGRAAAVFVGTPIALRMVEQKPTRNLEEIEYVLPRIFTFSVEQTFLGLPQTREIEVSTGMGGGDCGYDFKLGNRYLIYAFESSKSHRLTTSTCTRTRPFTDASEDFEFFRSFGSRGAGVTVQGQVKRARQSVATGNPSEWRPLANTGLTVEQEGERKDILTDAEGRFRLTGLSRKFKLTPLLPDELYPKHKELTVSDLCG
jgi:hypothetical protein